MTAAEAKEIRLQMNLTVPDLFRLTGIPTRTIQSYELGERKVPDKYKAKLLTVRDTMAETMRRIMDDINNRLDRLYPNGIPSAPAPDMETEL